MAERDGGPAFGHCDPTHGGHPGMSLRDYFAAAALSGIMANPERWKQIAEDYTSGRKTYEQCSAANAAKAWSLADAMLAERGKADPLRDAAPDLLAALEMLHKWFEIKGSSIAARWKEIPPKDRLAIVNAARAAIAKAKGGEG